MKHHQSHPITRMYRVMALFMGLLSICEGASSMCRAPSAATKSFCEQPPVDDVVLSSYAGTWYQAYSNANALFVGKPLCIQARYTTLSDGSVGVLNCYFYPGEMKRPQCVSGNARRGKSSSRLRVSFGGRGSGPYMIAGLLGDSEYGYSAVAVYSCSFRNEKPREDYFILVRDPYRPEEKLRQLRWKLWCKGYDVQNVKFIKTEQGNGCKYWFGTDGYDVRKPQLMNKPRLAAALYG